MPPTSLAVRPIRADDDFKSLSLGHKDYVPLKTFLKRDAWDFERCCVARTHVLVGAEHCVTAGRIWGYITLVASEVVAVANSIPPAQRWSDDYRVPAVKIARMAIDSELQGKGWGNLLLSTALALVKDHVSRNIGCRLIVTDAKQAAVSFYEKQGFSMLDTSENRALKTPIMFMKLDRLVP